MKYSLFLSIKIERLYITNMSKWYIIYYITNKGVEGMNIKEYRIKSGYTQSEVANVLNIKQSSYSRKELGKRAFTTDEIKILKELFKVSYEELLN